MIVGIRDLTLRDGSRDVKIQIRIHAPEQDSPGVWGCRYEVDWPGENRSVVAWGIDAIQALLIALGMVGAEIYSSNYHKSGNLFWIAPSKGYGFPVAPTIRDLLEGDDAKYL